MPKELRDKKKMGAEASEKSLDYNQAIENQVAVLTRAVDSLMDEAGKKEVKAKKNSEKEIT